MNKHQYRKARKDFRFANSAYGWDHGIATARNSHDYHATRNSRLTGWNWRIAQQFGEGTATTMWRIFTTQRFGDHAMSCTLQQRLQRYWEKKQRTAILNVALARCDELYGTNYIRKGAALS